jgi:hypothetical protein
MLNIMNAPDVTSSIKLQSNMDLPIVNAILASKLITVLPTRRNSIGIRFPTTRHKQQNLHFPRLLLTSLFFTNQSTISRPDKHLTLSGSFAFISHCCTISLTSNVNAAKFSDLFFSTVKS